MTSEVNYIIVGCDLHAQKMAVCVAVNREQAKSKSYYNRKSGRKKLIANLKKLSAAHGNARIALAYEASCLGYTLHDELREAGIDCYVLAPSKIIRSPKGRATKTDKNDARLLFEILRGHLLAGNELPSIVVPEQLYRDARDITRARTDAVEKQQKIKTQITMLLKKQGVEKNPDISRKWTKAFMKWLDTLCEDLPWGAQERLSALVEQLAFAKGQVDKLTEKVEELAHHEAMICEVTAMAAVKGVGIVTAMTLLAELGDVERFNNGKQVAAYLGLVPRTNESGEADDRKGHITRQGSSAGRRVLNQAVWSAIRYDPELRDRYERIAKRNPKKKMKAVVACMRLLARKLWRTAVEARKTQRKLQAAST